MFWKTDWMSLVSDTGMEGKHLTRVSSRWQLWYLTFFWELIGNWLHCSHFSQGRRHFPSLLLFHLEGRWSVLTHSNQAKGILTGAFKRAEISSMQPLGLDHVWITRTSVFSLTADWQEKKNSANGKFRLFDDFKINILTARRAIKGIPFSPQSEMFDWDVMLSEAFSTAVCWEIVGRDQGETHRQESKHSAVM